MDARLVVPRLLAQRRMGMHRVDALIDQIPLWFRSPDVPLRPAPETVIGSLLISALHHRRTIECAEPVCAQWAANVEQALAVLQRWWNFPLLRPALRPAAPAPSRAGRTALLFTGGVDSFYTLLRYPEPVDALLFCMPRDKPVHAAITESYLRRIAKASGKTPIFVQTNLLEHPSYRGALWWQTHGAALTSLVHLLDQEYSKLVVSSSYTYAYNVPNGSHFELDPLWASSRVEIVHWGADRGRREKIAEMIDEPLLHEFLMPCTEPTMQGNCQHCEKCIRTQLALLVQGKLDRFTAFECSTPLLDRIERLRSTHGPLQLATHPFYKQFMLGGLPADIHQAVRTYLDYSKRSVRRQHRRQKWLSWLGIKPVGVRSVRGAA